MKNNMRKKGSALVKSNEKGVGRTYAAWIADLKRRYRATQIKAAVAVNSALIEFYWNLGKDISEKFAEEARYGSRFFEKVSYDMRTEFPNDSGFSPRNIRYCQGFYLLYSSTVILPQVVAKSVKGKRDALKMPQIVAECGHRQLADDNVQQVVARNTIVSSPNTILKSLVCQWASPTMNSRKCFPPKRSWQSASLMLKGRLPLQRKAGGNERKD